MKNSWEKGTGRRGANRIQRTGITERTGKSILIVLAVLIFALVVLVFLLVTGCGNTNSTQGTEGRIVAGSVSDNNGTESAQTEQKDAATQTVETVSQQLSQTGAYLYAGNDNPSYGSLGGEWLVLGMKRSGYEVPDTYYKTYVKNVEQVVTEKKGVLHGLQMQ